MNKKLDRMGLNLETVKEEFINKKLEKLEEEKPERKLSPKGPRMYNGPIRKNSLLSNAKLDGLGAGLGGLQPHISPVSSKRHNEIAFVGPH